MLSPPVESLATVNGLKHSSVDVTVQSLKALRIRGSVSKHLAVFSKPFQNSGSFVSLVFHKVKGLSSYGHGSATTRCSHRFLVTTTIVAGDGGMMHLSFTMERNSGF